MKRFVVMAAAVSLGWIGVARAGIHTAGGASAGSMLDDDPIATVATDYAWESTRTITPASAVAPMSASITPASMSPHRAAAVKPVAALVSGAVGVRTFAISSTDPLGRPSRSAAGWGRSGEIQSQSPVAAPLPPAAPAGFAMLALLAVVGFFKRKLKRQPNR